MKAFIQAAQTNNHKKVPPFFLAVAFFVKTAADHHLHMACLRCLDISAPKLMRPHDIKTFQYGIAPAGFQKPVVENREIK